MTTFQRLLLYTDAAVILVTLVGLLVRRRYRVCYTFPLYLGAVAVSHVLVSTERFFSVGIWQLNQTVYSLLRFAIGVELAIRVSRAFPGARSALRGLLMVVLLATLFTTVRTSGTEAVSFQVVAGKVYPIILNGTVWLFTAIAGAILWFRLPVDVFHKALVGGFVCYLLVFTAALKILDSYGWQLRDWVNAVNPFAYLALLVYWAHTTWRPVRETVSPLPMTAAEPSLKADAADGRP